MRAEYDWASTRAYAAGLYINTANPGPTSTHWGLPGPANCVDTSSSSDQGCAYNYGWNAAADALSAATASIGPPARPLSWWLDVETANSWNGTAAANSSTVQGYIEYLRSQGTGTVGVYSTGYQWTQITAGYTVPSSASTPAAPDWLAGASSISNARSSCDPAKSFSGGPIQLVQYPDIGFDGNYVCPVQSVHPGLLRATSSPALSTQILVDGEIADSWGLNWLKESSGSHTVCFTHVEGWTEPPCQTVTVNGGATTTATGTFTQRGELHVFTSPPVASQVTLDGNPTDDWGMFTDVPVGAHMVCYGKVANFDPPPCRSITVTAGTLTTTTGTFTSHPGALRQSGVGLLRVAQVSSPVPTQISIQARAGTPYIADSWGLNWLELAPGSYTVSFSHVQGWTEPPPQTVTVTAGTTTTVTATFTQRGELHVFTSPAVAGTIFIDGIPRDDWGVFTDIPTGSHTVCFGAATGFANTPPCQTVTINAGAQTNVTGTYS
jgi:hypothetical protein